MTPRSAGLVPEESGACVLFLEWDTAPTPTNNGGT